MKQSTDIWFCAFLMSKGHSIKNFNKTGNRARVVCFFEIEEETWKELKLEFNNSQLVKFKGLLEQVKDLAF